MSSIFLFENDEEVSKKINIDDLYEKRQKRDLKQLSIFNKILNRIHKRIEATSRNKNSNETHIWYLVPEFIVGQPIYDKGECLGYLVTQLEQNGFFIKYIHPNTLFVSWHNFVPSYVRHEIKKKMGIVLDERGNVINKEEEKEDENTKVLPQATKDGKVYNSIKDYKPTGLYKQDFFDKLENKLNK
jgi:hypothetical protein